MSDDLLPRGWRRVPIVTLCEQHVDCVNRTAPVVPERTPYRMIRTTNVRNGFIDTEHVRFVTEDTFKRWTRRLVPRRGDIILTREAPLGDVGKIRTNDAIFLGQRLYHFRPSAQLLDPDFLLYSLLGEDLQGQIKGFGSGSTVEHMRLEDVPNLQLNLPPLPIQRRIAGVLAAYDGLIENNQRRIKILEAMARAVYREWFVDENLPNTVPGESISIGRLGDLCRLQKEPFKEDLHSARPLLDLSRMTQHSLAPYEMGAPEELGTSRILFEPGDTLFGSIRCYLHKVNAVHFSGVTNTSVFVLRPRGPHLRSLAAIVASDKETIRWADTHSSGTKMPVISWSVLETMPAPLPTDSLASAFEKVTGPCISQIGALASRIQTLRRTRDLLLPRILSGQIMVGAA